MSGLLDLDGPRYGAAAGEAQQLVVFLHGLGADGQDLIALAPRLARRLPQAAFVSPHGPFPCDMAPFGRQWFSFQDASPEAILGGARLAAPVLNAFLDAELARHGLSDSQLALVGFSQGTMMALHVALRRPAACAGVLGYSGALIGAEMLADEIESRPPVLLLHGDADQVVPPQSLPAAIAALRANDVPVTSGLRPGLAHSIDERGLQLGADFLVGHLP